MSGAVAVLRKELREAFATPVAFAALAVFWAVTGYFFSFNLFFVHAVHMVTAFHNMSILLLLVLPLLTMRVFAEENKAGTAELLMTLPLGEWAIVLGKFAAAFLLLVLMLAGTATAVIPLALFGRPDLGPILGGYLGILLLGTAYVAIGLLVSSVSRNQFTAALVTWAALVLLWFADYAAILDALPRLTPVLAHLSFSVHYVDLIRGVLDLGSVVYFLSLVAASLVATAQLLRWRRI